MDRTCTCTKVCDCQNPDGEGVAHFSEECPVHNSYPKPNPECPVHGEMDWRQFSYRQSDSIPAEKRIPETDGTCTCTKECDCQNPDGEGVAHCSEECPEHNLYPWPDPNCPVHGKMTPLEFSAAIG